MSRLFTLYIKHWSLIMDGDALLCVRCLFTFFFLGGIAYIGCPEMFSQGLTFLGIFIFDHK
jgi:hypothetical protein